MNYLQLVRRCKSESGRSGSLPATVVDLAGDDQRLADWIADALLELERREHGWSWLRRSISGPTVVDQMGYLATDLDPGTTGFSRWVPCNPRPNGYRVMAEQTAGSPWPLRFMEWVQFRDTFVVTDHQSGGPQVWSVDQSTGKLYVGPKPDSIYTLRADYWAQPQQLSLDADTPAFPAEFHMILVWRALMDMASYDAAPEVMARAQTNFTAIETDLVARFGPDIEQIPRLGY